MLFQVECLACSN
ncbi:hypothetical protein CP061683_0987A, partial [Chlamydia psittaci 06-1683]